MQGSRFYFRFTYPYLPKKNAVVVTWLSFSVHILRLRVYIYVLKPPKQMQLFVGAVYTTRFILSRARFVRREDSHAYCQPTTTEKERPTKGRTRKTFRLIKIPQQAKYK